MVSFCPVRFSSFNFKTAQCTHSKTHTHTVKHTFQHFIQHEWHDHIKDNLRAKSTIWFLGQADILFVYFLYVYVSLFATSLVFFCFFVCNTILFVLFAKYTSDKIVSMPIMTLFVIQFWSSTALVSVCLEMAFRTSTGRLIKQREKQRRNKLAVSNQGEVVTDHAPREEQQLIPYAGWQEGRRIVELSHLAEYLQCDRCSRPLELRDTESEIKYGRASLWRLNAVVVAT